MSHVPSAPGRQAGSFYPQLRLARLWLPAAIVGVVLFWQLVIVQLGGDGWRFWSTLLFYSILGPAVTYLVLNWIATQVLLREEAQARLGTLYSELQESHELLAGIQRVTEDFATASDLESTLAAAARGLTDVAGAAGALVTIDLAGVRISDSQGLSAQVRDAALERLDTVPEGGAHERETAGGHTWSVLSERIGRPGRLSGTVQAWFRDEADERQREAFNIIAAEYAAAAEAAGSRMRDLATLVEVDRSMRAEGNLSRLLELLLASMMQRTGASAGGILLAEEGGLLHLTALQGPDAPVQQPPIRPGSGVIGSVAERLEPLVISDLDSRPGTRAESPLLETARSLLVLPLQSDGMLLGLIVLAHGAPGHFQASGIPLLELMAGQVSWGVRNARAYLHSEELAIAEERARIAREIHDGVAQSLAFTALKLDLIDRLRERDPDKAAAELATVRSTVREMIREVRRSIFALRPVQLERHGFSETIRRYSVDFGQQNDMEMLVDIGPVGDLTLKSETILFRIFQEAMNNVAKHSKARQVAVSVGRTGAGGAFVQVRDDGIGFNPELVADRVTSVGGLGLRQMRERVAAQGGTLAVTSSAGAGTAVRAEIPA